jgi:deoxycytidine triphosphate deaminase
MSPDQLEELNKQTKEQTSVLAGNVDSDLQALRARKPETFEEARRRFTKWRRTDPYPAIAPALLNCGAFCDYIVTTGMIFPFTVDKELIKLASYDFCLLGRAVYWEPEGERKDFVIERGKLFTLKANSIAFVTLEPFLQLPDYIALRFNLRITNVYRGLLLGTGPIIDPGYQGKLSIPLHNLTTNSYELVGGDALISVEFTKLLGPYQAAPSQQDQPASAEPRSSLHVPFPEPSMPDPEKTDRNVSNYLRKANSGSIQSSIPRIVFESRQAAEKASLVAAATIVGILIALIGLLSAVWDSHTASRAVQTDLRNRLERQEVLQSQMQNQVRVLQDSMIRIRGRLRP